VWYFSLMSNELKQVKLATQKTFWALTLRLTNSLIVVSVPNLFLFGYFLFPFFHFCMTTLLQLGVPISVIYGNTPWDSTPRTYTHTYTPITKRKYLSYLLVFCFARIPDPCCCNHIVIRSCLNPRKFTPHVRMLANRLFNGLCVKFECSAHAAALCLYHSRKGNKGRLFLFLF